MTTDKTQVLQIKEHEEEIIKAKQSLTPDQIEYAQWMALPKSKRKPQTEKEWAEIHNVTRTTCFNWRKLPIFWTVRDSYITEDMKRLVPEAAKVLGELIHSENAKVALDAALEVLDRYSIPKQHEQIANTLKDIVLKAQEEERRNAPKIIVNDNIVDSTARELDKPEPDKV